MIITNKTIVFFLIFFICLTSFYMLKTISVISTNNEILNIHKNKNQHVEKENSNEFDIYNNNNDFTGGSFKPSKKVIIVEKEIVKEVIKEVINENQIDLSGYDNNNNNNNGLDCSSNYDVNKKNFKDDRSLLNYFLTYQYYYQFENYKNRQYTDKNKYNLSLYHIPQVHERNNIDEEIEKWEIKIQEFNNTHNNEIYVQPPKNDPTPLQKEFQAIVVKKLREIVWKQFYSDYNKYNGFLQFAKDNGIDYKPPRLPLPLDTSKPLLTTPYLFLHMPKTGGHTMFDHLSKSLGTGSLQQWAHPFAHEYQKVKNASKLIFGHWEYGIHNLLTEENKKTYTYLTMLRDPVDRVISHYFYHKAQRYDPEHLVASQNTLEQWLVQSPRGNNEQTRVLSGITKAEEFMPTNETLNMALYHLRTMKFVGITERFEETLALLKFFTGLDDVRVSAKKNVGRLKPTQITPEVIELIKQRNWMDIILYEEACKMFQRQIDLVGKENFDSQLKKIILPPNNNNNVNNKSNNNNNNNKYNNNNNNNNIKK